MEQNHFQFLLVGAGRGGTSLLAGLLDQHSQLEVGFEYQSEAILMGKTLASHDIEARMNAFIAACDQEAARYPDKIWGNKITTEQLFGLNDHNTTFPQDSVDIIERFFTRLDKKGVFILRDGRTCVRSKMRRVQLSLEQACERWQFSVQVYHYLMKQQPEQYLCIRYEDLLVHPAATLQKICPFLGLNYEEGMLRGTSNVKMLADYQQATFDLSKLALVDIPEGCTSLIKPELQQCGYTQFLD